MLNCVELLILKAVA